MKIALLQINPTVGALRGNRQKTASALARAAGADLAVTSEMSILGSLRDERRSCICP